MAAKKKKFYAVRKGRCEGIFLTWTECKQAIDGFSGAVYKSFLSREEAEAYLQGEKVSTPVSFPPTAAVAYVDGSYHDGRKEFAYGAVFFFGGEEEHFSGRDNDPDLAEMRNVAGEIKGAQRAMELCLERGIPELFLHHDYEGIARWCTGEWQARKAGTKKYRDFYQGLKDKLVVHFVKVKGHSGDKYNDLADLLAKKALNLV